MKKFRILLLLAAVMLEVGCGLPDTFFLHPPTVTTPAPGPGFFQFNNPAHDSNHDINVNFIGVELYYRFYSNISAINQNVYNSSSPSDVTAQLSGAGFLPVVAKTDVPSTHVDPLINLESLASAGSSVAVTVSYNSTSTYAINAGIPVEIRRSVPDPSNATYRVFETNTNTTSFLAYQNYQATDQDMIVDSTVSSLISLAGTNQVYLAMYALSYGFTNTSTPSRSTPVYLGYVSIVQF